MQKQDVGQLIALLKPVGVLEEVLVNRIAEALTRESVRGELYPAIEQLRRQQQWRTYQAKAAAALFEDEAGQYFNQP
jgi:hypothetical protein